MTLNDVNLDKAFDYKGYRTLIDSLMKEGKTTGTTQTEDYLHYAKLNQARMQRLEKTGELYLETKQALDRIKQEFVWIVITEGWCGDAAQNITPLFLMSEYCKKIDLKLVLRDENLDLMDNYLTNGSRSIPKLICFNKKTNQEVFIWGPRPAEAQKIVSELIAKKASLEEKSIVAQKWYNEDKTVSLQKEFVDLINSTMCGN